VIGDRYVIGESFASGGAGMVHVGRVRGAGGFARVVAVKRLFPAYSEDAELREMLLHEARLASRIRHPNVVPVLDVVQSDKDVYLVMEYVHGVPLARLLKRGAREPMPIGVAVGILEGVLSGLHAAHEARGEDGTPLGIVHRDVSPQNVLVGADGIARLIDFGIAKAASQHPVTEPGVVKGKRAYMAPEQLRTERVSRHADIFAAAAILWEALAGRALIDEHPEDRLMARMTVSESVPPSRYREGIDPRLDRAVLRGLALKPSDRFPTAAAMAAALREAVAPARAVEIAAWLERVAADDLELSEERVRLLEQSSIDGDDADATTKTARPRTTRARTAARVAGGFAIIVAFVVALRTSARAPLVASVAKVSPPIADAPTPVPSSRPDASTLPAATASVSARAAPSTLAPSSSRPSRAPSARCDPPYTLDANGRKHYDRSCF
jgi:serine/threonine protein kinase